MFIFISKILLCHYRRQLIYIPLCLYLYPRNLCPGQQHLLHLHSTMFIFIFYAGWPKAWAAFHLHSAMFIFISFEEVSRWAFWKFTFHYVYIYMYLNVPARQKTEHIYIPLCLYLYRSDSDYDYIMLHIYIPLCLYLYAFLFSFLPDVDINLHSTMFIFIYFADFNKCV